MIFWVILLLLATIVEFCVIAIHVLRSHNTVIGRRTVFSILLCVGIVVAGGAGMVGLKLMARRPPRVTPEERPIRVQALAVQPEDAAITITGYGEVRPLNEVTLAPEVSGRVVTVHPRLEVGEVIPEGEVLFAVDKRDYEARLAEARAAVTQLSNTVERLEKQYAIDKDRLKTLHRSRDLAKAEFDRVRRLFSEDQVGTQSGVDQAERAYNAAVDQADQLEQAVKVYPLMIEEAQANLDSAGARRELAETNLQRTVVQAPFNARIKQVALEQDQYVAPGMQVLTLADDSILEISVPLDSREARRWLLFTGDRSSEGSAWFNGLAPVSVAIRWTDDKEGHVWEGTLHRVEEFNSDTRTLTVAVRIPESKSVANGDHRLPLVEGMFCEVAIPGRTMEQCYRIPRSAVTFEETVYVIRDGRLVTVPVDVGHEEAGFAYVTGGLEPGAEVILTRLVNPLENALVEVEPAVAVGSEESEQTL